MITSTYTPEYYSLWYFSGHFYTRQKCINSTVEAPFYRGHGGILQPYCRCSEKNWQSVNISPPEIGLWRAPMFVPVTTLGQYKTTNFNGFPTKEKDFFWNCTLYQVYWRFSTKQTFYDWIVFVMESCNLWDWLDFYFHFWEQLGVSLDCCHFQVKSLIFVTFSCNWEKFSAGYITPAQRIAPLLILLLVILGWHSIWKPGVFS